MASFLRRQRPPEEPATTAVDDACLIDQARDDREAFALLYRRHFAGIYSYCYRSLGTPERAEDAAQQVFEQALSSLPRYREAGRFRSWLYAIAHNVIRSQITGQRQVEPLDALGEVPDAGISPEDQTLGALDHRALLEAIARLPADQRLAIELRVAGLKGREIAEEMGRSHEAVRMLQKRAIDRLSSELVVAAHPRGGRHDV